MSELSSILRLEYGAALSAENRTGWGYPVFGSNGEVGRHAKYLIVDPGIVVGRKGSVGQVSWSDEPFWPIDTAYWVDCRPDDRRWLFWLLSYLPLKRLDTSTGVPGLNRNDVYELSVFRPDAASRDKIAEVLDTLDAAIRGTEAVVAKLWAMKQGLLHDLLTRGIDANGDLRPPQPEAPHLYHQTPLGWLPKEWEETTLGAIAEVGRGQFTHRPRNDPRFYGGEFPFIQTGDVAAAKGDFVTRYSQTLNERGVSVSREFPAGTIAITIAANIADTGILAFPMFFPDSVVGAVVHDGLNTRFVELWIRRTKRLLDARAPQSAQKNINLQDLRPLEVFLPSKEEQDAIGDRYEALFAKLSREQRLLNKLRLQKSGLMDDLLTGRVPVTPLL